MKILVIGPFPEPIFGVSLSNVVLTTGLRTKGFKVKTINTSTSKKINPTSGDWSFSKLVFFKYYLQLFKVINSDVIYCTTGQSFFGILKYAPFVLLARVLNRKTVVHVKGGYLKASYENMNNFKKIVSKRVLQLYNKGIVLSESLKPLLEEFLDPEKIFIQHNFIQHSLILSEKEVFKRKDFEGIRIIFLSNLIPEKGIYQLLDALDELNSNGKLNFIENDELKEYIQKYYQASMVMNERRTREHGLLDKHHDRFRIKYFNFKLQYIPSNQFEIDSINIRNGEIIYNNSSINLKLINDLEMKEYLNTVGFLVYIIRNDNIITITPFQKSIESILANLRAYFKENNIKYN